MFETAIRGCLFKCGPAALMSLRGVLENCALAMFFTLLNIDSFRQKLYAKWNYDKDSVIRFLRVFEKTRNKLHGDEIDVILHIIWKGTYLPKLINVVHQLKA